jgi:hypothetical protein
LAIYIYIASQKRLGREDWVGSPAITGHQRDVEGIYMVLNARNLQFTPRNGH